MEIRLHRPIIAVALGRAWLEVRAALDGEAAGSSEREDPPNE